MCSGTALGFFWALGGMTKFGQELSASDAPLAAAERRELYRFSADLGKLALRIADHFGTSYEKWFGILFYLEILLTCCTSRALVLFSAMVSGFDNVHIRANLARLEDAKKYGQSAGDK